MIATSRRSLLITKQTTLLRLATEGHASASRRSPLISSKLVMDQLLLSRSVSDSLARVTTYVGTNSVKPAVKMSATAHIRSKFTQALRRTSRPTFS
jgi:hypothetical protein